MNHSAHFVVPQTGVHTQAIESYWNRHKAHIKMMRGCRRDLMHAYIQEFMWRDRFAINAFVNVQYVSALLSTTLCIIILYSICMHHMTFVLYVAYITYILI